VSGELNAWKTIDVIPLDAVIVHRAGNVEEDLLMLGCVTGDLDSACLGRKVLASRLWALSDGELVCDGAVLEVLCQRIPLAFSYAKRPSVVLTAMSSTVIYADTTSSSLRGPLGSLILRTLSLRQIMIGRL